MTFQDTLTALSVQTEHTTIYALISYGDGKIGMGFRREWYGTNLRNPIIDNTVFMLCADAWNTNLLCPITRTDDLICTPNEDIQIRLRAVGGFPYTTINLGDYRVISMHVEEKEEVLFMSGPRKIPSAIRLEIERD